MKLLRLQFLHLAAGAAAPPPVSRIARAEAYPTRPVHWAVGFPPGGGNDIVARVMGRVDRALRSDQQKREAVRRRSHDELGADILAAAWTVRNNVFSIATGELEWPAQRTGRRRFVSANSLACGPQKNWE
jgi:hypothetical protein